VVPASSWGGHCTAFHYAGTRKGDLAVVTDRAGTDTGASFIGRARYYLWLLWVVWLVELAYPLGSLRDSHPSPLRAALVLSGAALFVAIYAWNVWTSVRRMTIRAEGRPGRRAWLTLGILTGLALALAIGDRAAWLELLIFVGVSMGPCLPPRQAIAGVAATIGLELVVGVPLLGVGTAAPGALTIFASSVGVIIIVRTIVLDRELQLARDEIARLAVSEERLRFARDLHDLLGHSLSLIALKSELAGRLAERSPEKALAEIRDVEVAAREALREVREAVAGYRRPTLESELRSAGELLAAAGIEWRCGGDAGTLHPAQEAALSWVVREGITNVIRHSRAHRCTVRLDHDATAIRLEISDDGRGTSGELSHQPGSGLPGLQERIEQLNGTVHAGDRVSGGFQLSVSLPLARANEAGGSTVAQTVESSA